MPSVTDAAQCWQPETLARIFLGQTHEAAGNRCRRPSLWNNMKYINRTSTVTGAEAMR